MTVNPPARKISDADIARIRKTMLELGAEIGQFGAALASYQSRVRRMLVQPGDAGERGTAGGFP